MRDLWTELASRVRKSGPPEPPPMPFGFEQRVLERLARSPSSASGPLEGWIPLLRPALGLALGTAMLCLIFTARPQSAMPNNLVSQTEALLQSAILDE